MFIYLRYKFINLNEGSLGYEPEELPDCSTPR